MATASGKRKRVQVKDIVCPSLQPTGNVGLHLDVIRSTLQRRDLWPAEGEVPENWEEVTTMGLASLCGHTQVYQTAVDTAESQGYCWMEIDKALRTRYCGTFAVREELSSLLEKWTFPSTYAPSGVQEFLVTTRRLYSKFLRVYPAENREFSRRLLATLPGPLCDRVTQDIMGRQRDHAEYATEEEAPVEELLTSIVVCSRALSRAISGDRVNHLSEIDRQPSKFITPPPANPTHHLFAPFPGYPVPFWPPYYHPPTPYPGTTPPMPVQPPASDVIGRVADFSSRNEWIDGRRAKGLTVFYVSAPRAALETIREKFSTAALTALNEAGKPYLLLARDSADEKSLEEELRALTGISLRPSQWRGPRRDFH